jgi:hypothetical protein
MNGNVLSADEVRTLFPENQPRPSYRPEKKCRIAA